MTPERLLEHAERVRAVATPATRWQLNGKLKRLNARVAAGDDHLLKMRNELAAKDEAALAEARVRADQLAAMGRELEEVQARLDAFDAEEEAA